MARSAQEKAELCREFILSESPRWLLHPTVVRKLGLRRVMILSDRLMRRNRGYATHEGDIMLSLELARFRSASPYTTPKGKADISPVGVFAHEFGHILDFAVHKKFGHKANSPTWVWYDIHSKLRRHGITSYARTCAGEDFAEAHRLFVLNRKLLKELSPERFSHMKQMYKMLLGTEHPHKVFTMSAHEFECQFNKFYIHAV
jgi:hypothetical protein